MLLLQVRRLCLNLVIGKTVLASIGMLPLATAQREVGAWVVRSVVKRNALS